MVIVGRRDGLRGVEDGRQYGLDFLGSCFNHGSKIGARVGKVTKAASDNLSRLWKDRIIIAGLDLR